MNLTKKGRFIFNIIGWRPKYHFGSQQLVCLVLSVGYPLWSIAGGAVCWNYLGEGGRVPEGGRERALLGSLHDGGLGRRQCTDAATLCTHGSAATQITNNKYYDSGVVPSLGTGGTEKGAGALSKFPYVTPPAVHTQALCDYPNNPK